MGVSALTLFPRPSAADVRAHLLAQDVLLVEPAGYAAEDGVGLHYVDQDLHEAVTLRSGSQAWWVDRTGDGRLAETAVPARLL